MTNESRFRLKSFLVETKGNIVKKKWYFLESVEASGITHNGLYSVNCVRIPWVKHKSFRFPPKW